VGRYKLSPDKTDQELVQRDVLAFLNGSNVLTLRWLRPAGDLVSPKNMLHLPNIKWDMVPTKQMHEPRDVPELCEEA
jgi:hypothetical protein